MSFIETINKAREKGLTDEQILDAIKKQNPSKEAVFNDALQKGSTATQILNEIINQNKEVPEGKSGLVENNNKKKINVKKEEITLSPEDLPKSIPSKPSQEAKLWMRIFITLGLVSITALSFTVLYRALFVPTLEPIKPQINTVRVFSPAAGHPLIRMYPEKDDVYRIPIEIDGEYKMHLRRIMREEKSGDIIRVIMEDLSSGVGDRARISNLEDFFRIFSIDYPEIFFDTISKDFNLFIYTKEAINKIGFVTKFPEDKRQHVEMIILRPWEETIESDFQDFFNFWGVEIPETKDDLLNMSFKGDLAEPVVIRYREGSRGFGLYYSIRNDHLFFATSEDMIKELLVRNYNLRLRN